MKKVLLSLSVIALTGAFAQKSQRIVKSSELSVTAPKSAVQSTPNNKVLTTLWSDDFSTPANWTIDNSGQTGATFGWNINNTREGWWSTNPTGMSTNGTSGGNNAELVNGNPTLSPPTQALNVIYTLTTAQPINVANLGGTNQVSLEFKQFGARFNDLQEMQISVDGINFVTVGDNLDKSVLSQSGGSAYPNPETKLVNLATFLPANPTSVWIRFRWTTNFPGSASNANVWVAYGWYIDDVKIVMNPQNDLSVTSNFWGSAGLNYYQIPTTQVAPIEFESRVYNGGLAAQTGSFLKADVLSGANTVYTGTSTPTNVPSLDTATLTVSTTFTPPATVANYTLKRKVTLGYLPNGQILTGSLTNGGSDYVTGNNIATTGGAGTGATVNITATPLGTVSAGIVESAGENYITQNNVTTIGGSGTGLTLNITATPIVVSSIQPNQQGSGYVDGTNIPVSGGTGTGMTVDITASSWGGIATITINNPGTGYSNQDMLTVASGDNNGNFMVITTGGEITAATVVNGGTGYQAGDVMGIIGSQGMLGNFKVTTTTGGVITSVAINNPGSGYAVGDVLNIVDGSASFTVATVTNNTEVTDEIPANNAIADVNFAVTNYVYARDNNVFSGSTTNGTNGFESGNLFDIYQDQTLKGINVRIQGGSGGSTVGTEVYAKIYGIGATGEFEFIEESAPILIANANLNAITAIPLLSPVNLSAGNTYLAVVGAYGAGLRISNAGESEDQTTFLLDLSDETWYFSNSTPVVRLNFDPILGVNENDNIVTGVNVYPNPSNGVATIKFNANQAGDATIAVYDMAGKLVANQEMPVGVGTASTQINATSWNSGVYFVNVAVNGSVVTKKFIKH